MTGPDLRLVAPAVTCWLAVAVSSGWPGRRQLAAAVGTLLVGLAWSLVYTTRRRSCWPVAVALLAAAAGLAANGVRAVSRTEGPLPRLAGVRSAAEVRVTVSGDPVVHDGVARGSGRPYHLVLVPVQVLRLTAAGRTWQLTGPYCCWLRTTPGVGCCRASTWTPPDGCWRHDRATR